MDYVKDVSWRELELLNLAGSECHIRFRYHSSWAHCDFEVYEPISFHQDGAVTYECKDEHVRKYSAPNGKPLEDRETSEIEKAQTMVRGTVKWDGCSHVYFGEDDGGYLHLCGTGNWHTLVLALGYVFNHCRGLLLRDHPHGEDIGMLDRTWLPDLSGVVPVTLPRNF